MNFNEHWNLQGKHAFLGASKYHWINYSHDKLIQSYLNFQAVERGTELHELAAKMINMGIKAQKTKQTFNMYVNDAIGFGMSPEVVLYYSDNCFGTTDAIRWDEKKRFLRIHDLKTGVTPAHMEQLEIYAALFCLEYHVDPMTIKIELRLYQNDEILVCNEETNDDLNEVVKNIMQIIIESDKTLRELN